MDASIEENRGARQRHEKSGGRKGASGRRRGDFRLRRKTAGTHGGFNRDGGRWFFRHMLAINDFAEYDATVRFPSLLIDGVSPRMVTFVRGGVGIFSLRCDRPPAGSDDLLISRGPFRAASQSTGC